MTSYALFANITDDIIFRAQFTNPERGSLKKSVYQPEMYKHYEQPESQVEVFLCYFLIANHTIRDLIFQGQFAGRPASVVLLYSNDTFLDFYIKNADSGKYVLMNADLCFTVYVLDYPDVTLTINHATNTRGLQTSEEGVDSEWMCTSVSTTLPSNHNLTMNTLWYVNGVLAGKYGRIASADDVLVISSLKRTDHNLTITCEVKEDMGLTSQAHATVHVSWGPYKGPVLQPSQTVYKLKTNWTLPTIICSADCNPRCDITWLHQENMSVQ